MIWRLYSTIIVLLDPIRWLNAGCLRIDSFNLVDWYMKVAYIMAATVSSLGHRNMSPESLTPSVPFCIAIQLKWYHSSCSRFGHLQLGVSVPKIESFVAANFTEIFFFTSTKVHSFLQVIDRVLPNRMFIVKGNWVSIRYKFKIKFRVEKWWILGG